MLDNKTIQLKGSGSGRGWDNVQRCAGKWKQQWQIERRGGTNYATASGLRSIFKQIAAAGKAEKSISISYSGKKKENVFPFVKGELKAQSAL